MEKVICNNNMNSLPDPPRLLSATKTYFRKYDLKPIKRQETTENFKKMRSKPHNLMIRRLIFFIGFPYLLEIQTNHC